MVSVSKRSFDVLPTSQHRSFGVEIHKFDILFSSLDVGVKILDFGWISMLELFDDGGPSVRHCLAGAKATQSRDCARLFARNSVLL